jgi:MscS family membrane protein
VLICTVAARLSRDAAGNGGFRLGLEECRVNLRLLLYLVFACGVFSAPLSLAAEPGTSAAKSSAKSAEPTFSDPLGRSTPHGTVSGFLRAAERSDYKRAAEYLEGKPAAKEKERRARDLQVVLNRGVKSGLGDLSRTPEGNLDDDISPYVERIGTAVYGEESLEIVLRRTTKSDTPPIWLFSSETLLRVGVAAEQLDIPWTEAIWPDSFREIRFQSHPLFRLLNGLMLLAAMIAAAWILTLVLLWLGRPWLLRHLPAGDRAITQLKWIMRLLLFAGAALVIAAQPITMVGRSFVGYLGKTLMIVAIIWMLIGLTKFLTHSKTQHLRHVNLPGKIAAVELFSWLFIFIWIVAGLFLILGSLGIELTAALAGLGVGTIAVAFAAQKTLENLFGTVMVVGDDVVKVGDYCQAGAIEGRIESIGLRSTRIRTLDRAVVSIPNGQLASMTVGNLADRDKFLFRHSIRLRYDTTADQLEEVLAKIRSTMLQEPRLEAESVRASLVRFGDAALEVEVFAYARVAESEIFTQIQHDLLVRIMRIIEASGTAAAPPLRTPAIGAFGLQVEARDGRQRTG